MVHTEPSLPKDWIVDACKVVDWLSVTDDVMPNPYETLPSYLTDLAKVINNKCNHLSKLGIILGIVFGVLGGIAIGVLIFFAVKKYRLKKTLKKTVIVIHEEKL